MRVGDRASFAERARAASGCPASTARRPGIAAIATRATQVGKNGAEDEALLLLLPFALLAFLLVFVFFFVVVFFLVLLFVAFLVFLLFLVAFGLNLLHL